MQETQFQLLDWENPLEEGMATHSCILAWEISWTNRKMVKMTLYTRQQRDTDVKNRLLDSVVESETPILWPPDAKS